EYTAERLPVPSARAGGRKPRRPRGRRRAGGSGGGPAPPPPGSPRVGPTSRASYLNYDGENHRAPPRSVVDQLRDRVMKVLLKELDLGDVLTEKVSEHAVGLGLHLVHQRPRLGQPARDQLG